MKHRIDEYAGCRPHNRDCRAYVKEAGTYYLVLREDENNLYPCAIGSSVVPLDAGQVPAIRHRDTLSLWGREYEVNALGSRNLELVLLCRPGDIEVK